MIVAFSRDHSIIVVPPELLLITDSITATVEYTKISDFLQIVSSYQLQKPTVIKKINMKKKFTIFLEKLAFEIEKILGSRLCRFCRPFF